MEYMPSPDRCKLCLILSLPLYFLATLIPPGERGEGDTPRNWMEVCGPLPKTDQNP